jgi:hypothetical protein
VDCLDRNSGPFLNDVVRCSPSLVRRRVRSTKKAQLVGTISQVEWINPHTYIHIDVKDEHGAVATWRLESLPTAMMRKAGLTKDLLMGDGSPVTADVILARDGTQNLAWVIKLAYADGHYYQLSAPQN